MAILSILIGLFTFSPMAHAQSSPEAEKQPFNLEVGLGLGYSHAEGGLPQSSGRALFSVILGYHWPEWFFGITTRGAFSTAGETRIQTAQALEVGNLTHRTIEYGLIARRYFSNEWYAQIGGGLGYNEAIASDQNLIPNPSPYFDRFYLDGTWLQAAVGKEFKDSPWFVRFEYTYTFYYRSHIVSTQQGVNLNIEENNVLNRPHEQIFAVVVGLANIF